MATARRQYNPTAEVRRNVTSSLRIGHGQATGSFEVARLSRHLLTVISHSNRPMTSQDENKMEKESPVELTGEELITIRFRQMQTW